MKCEACGQNEATVHFKQVSDGVSREMHLCEGCASETDFTVAAQASVTDVLFGSSFQAGGLPAGGGKQCPACRIREADFRKMSRLGCPSCYETFAEELTPLLKAMHKSSMHVGKIPACEQVSAEIATLEHDMEQAIAAQDFEGAASLRDRIRELRSELEANAHGAPAGAHGRP